MGMNNGNIIAKHVVQGVISVGADAWVPLQVGSAPQQNRFQVRIFPRSNMGMGIVLAYAIKDIDGVFTTPTTYVGNATLVSGGRIWMEPLADNVQLYGRLLQKGGETDASVKVVVTEFS